jgi:hypothetical protein
VLVGTLERRGVVDQVDDDVVPVVVGVDDMGDEARLHRQPADVGAAAAVDDADPCPEVGHPTVGHGT